MQRGSKASSLTASFAFHYIKVATNTFAIWVPQLQPHLCNGGYLCGPSMISDSQQPGGGLTRPTGYLQHPPGVSDWRLDAQT